MNLNSNSNSKPKSVQNPRQLSASRGTRTSTSGAQRTSEGISHSSIDAQHGHDPRAAWAYVTPSGSLDNKPADDAYIKGLKETILAFFASVDSSLQLKLSPEAFTALNGLANSGLFPGWDRSHIDFNGERLIIKRPSHTHKAFQELIFTKNPTLNKLICLLGSSNIALFGHTQIKSPDLSFHEKPKEMKIGADRDIDRNATPTVVVEIGYAETLKKLNYDAARLLMGTHGLIKLVINVKITAQAKEKLDWVTADLWTLTEIKLREQGCEIVDKDKIVFKDSESGDYVPASDGEDSRTPTSSRPTCWEYLYCFQSEEQIHTHFLVKPLEQYLVYYDQTRYANSPTQSATSLGKLPLPFSLDMFTPGPIEIPRFLLVTRAHHLNTPGTRCNIDLTIEFHELLEVIQFYMEKYDDHLKCLNQHSAKRTQENKDRAADTEEYIELKKRRKNDSNASASNDAA